MSCDSPYLPVIQAHLVALCLPIRKERVIEVIIPLEKWQKFCFSLPSSYLAANFSWRPTGPLKNRNKMFKPKFVSSTEGVMNLFLFLITLFPN